MAADRTKKTPLGEVRAIQIELEAFAGPAKPRGCPICRHGDQDIAKVARDKGYSGQQVADFLKQTRGYTVIDREAVYRHWHRCAAKKNRLEEKATQKSANSD